MTERFKRAYDKLVKAYLSGTLKAGDCHACAVGNICGGDSWVVSVMETRGNDRGCYEELYPDISPQSLLVFSGGYSATDLSKIESAFEKNTLYKKCDYHKFLQSEIAQDQFNGLSAVIDVMMKLDGMDQDKVELMHPFRQKLELA